MAEPILRMEPLRASVEPGGQVSAVVTVFNSGTVVEGYDLDVVAAVPLPWAQVSPPSLSVYPQQEATAVVTFAPPSGPGAPGGPIPFGVRVRSQVDPARSAVIEGDLDVGSVSGLQAVLTPVTSAGRWSGRHTVKVSNWGNAPARLRISPRDADQALGFLVSPQVLDLPLGSEGVARLKVRTRHPVLRGSPQRLPFQVVCEPDVPEELGGPRSTTSTPDRPVVDGTFNQKPILSRVVVSVAALVLLAGIGGLIYALTRSGDEAPAEEGRAPGPPTGVAASASPDVITLTWDAAQGVESYLLEQTEPVTDARPVTGTTDPADPTRLVLRLEAKTPARFCYQLRAVREGSPQSPPSTPPACTQAVLTPSASASPTPPEEASIAPMPVETEAPSPSTDTSAPTEAAAEPLEYAAVLKYYVEDGAPDMEQRAETDRLILDGLGVTAKVMFSADWTLEPPPDTPAWIVYVDGATPEAAQAACEQAAAASPDLVATQCIPAPLHVAPPALPTPTPTS